MGPTRDRQTEYAHLGRVALSHAVAGIVSAAPAINASRPGSGRLALKGGCLSEGPGVAPVLRMPSSGSPRCCFRAKVDFGAGDHAGFDARGCH